MKVSGPSLNMEEVPAMSALVSKRNIKQNKIAAIAPYRILFCLPASGSQVSGAPSGHYCISVRGANTMIPPSPKTTPRADKVGVT